MHVFDLYVNVQRLLVYEWRAAKINNPTAFFATSSRKIHSVHIQRLPDNHGLHFRTNSNHKSSMIILSVNNSIKISKTNHGA